jgi:uncharacterized protein (TIGR03118 family)
MVVFPNPFATPFKKTEVTMSTFLRHAAGPLLALSAIGGVAFGQHYNQTNLVANTSGIALVTDASLVNPWGIARSSSSPWWVADNVTGVSTLYNGAGTKSALTVTIPAAVMGKTGSPTGIIYNGSTTDFLLAPTMPAGFIFCTIDGTIVGWNHTLGAATVVKTTNGSVYTGLTSAVVNGQRRLYAANFTKGTVDVYDNTFHPIKAGDGRDDHGDREDSEGAFSDDRLPSDYVPFNVQAIGNDIVVTFALHEEGNPFETDGPGFGYVDIFSASGRLEQRLEHGDWLNAPWGVALAPNDFGVYSHDLLIGQFAGGGTSESSGYIAAYDLATGKFKGLLEDTAGKPLAINGVWGIGFGNSSPNDYNSAGAPSAELYFAAGPNHASGGLFGYVTAVSTELVEGNDQ